MYSEYRDHDSYFSTGFGACAEEYACVLCARAQCERSDRSDSKRFGKLGLTQSCKLRLLYLEIVQGTFRIYCVRIYTVMGGGKRILRWLKKCLFIEKLKRRFQRKKRQRTAVTVPTIVLSNSEEAIDQDNVTDSFSDVSLTNYLSSNLVESPLPAETKLLVCYGAEESEEVSTPGHPEADTVVTHGRKYTPIRVLPPIIEVHDEATPDISPELDITTSRLGNVAFEISFADKSRPKSASAIPERFSSMGKRSEKPCLTWKERMEKTEKIARPTLSYDRLI